MTRGPAPMHFTETLASLTNIFRKICAAAKVLAEDGGVLNCQEMIDAMAKKGYWTSPGGKTPAAMLYSAILREISTKGKEARFKKTERGKFSISKAS